MLTLVGLGLSDEKDLTLRGIEAAKNAEKVYVEFYTGRWQGSLKNLEKIIGKKIFVLKRNDLEENSSKILNEAKEKNVVIFVQGDPLVATTHISLLIEAKKFDVKAEIVHNASIISAIGETGLHIYKFGPTVTIPSAEKMRGAHPESIIKTISENKSRGLHTLCLLDVLENGKTITPIEGIEILKKLGINDNEKAIIFSNAGQSAKIHYGNLDELQAKKIEEMPAVIIICGNLHFTEEEFLKSRKA